MEVEVKGKVDVAVYNDSPDLTLMVTHELTGRETTEHEIAYVVRALLESAFDNDLDMSDEELDAFEKEFDRKWERTYDIDWTKLDTELKVDLLNLTKQNYGSVAFGSHDTKLYDTPEQTAMERAEQFFASHPEILTLINEGSEQDD